MKIEELGRCPCCYEGKNVSAHTVNFYAARQDNGDLVEIYIFGDDDFDMTSSNSTVSSVKFSDDKKSVTEVTCPRCNEKLLVSIPIIKDQSEFFKTLSPKAIPFVMAGNEPNQLQQ